MPTSALGRVLEPLIGDLGLVERVLPMTETVPTRGYYTRYHLTDNFSRFRYQELERYLGHVRALGNLPRPDALHLLFARAGSAEDVQCRAGAHHARLLTPADLLASFN